MKNLIDTEAALTSNQPKSKSRLNYSVYVINLDRSQRRLLDFEQIYAPHMSNITRVSAVDGRTLPKIASARLVEDDSLWSVDRGTLGCLLSHVAIWETISNNEIENALIVEDDSFPIRPLAASFSDYNIPIEYDICFANGRMSLARRNDNVTQFYCISMENALSHFLPTHNAPGADGYFLSRCGAEKLLDLFKKDGFSGDVDWRMLAYCTSDADLLNLEEDCTARIVLKEINRKFAKEVPLKGWVLSPPLIDTHSADSIRLEVNEMEANQIISHSQASEH